MYYGPIWADVTESRIRERTVPIVQQWTCRSWVFSWVSFLSIVTAKYAQDVEQAEEQVINCDIKCDGRHDVVCFTAV